MVDLLASDELEALLLHEKCHLKNHDPLKILLGRLTASALFFIPILKDLPKRYLIRKEIAADQSAILYRGSRRGIISALRKLLEGQSCLGAKGFGVSGTEALKYRIDYLRQRRSNDKIGISHIFVSLMIPAL